MVASACPARHWEERAATAPPRHLAPLCHSFYWDSLKIIDRHDYIGLDGKKHHARMTDNRHLLKDPKYKHIFGVHYQGK